jgi:phenylpropionate dioxygenase-like ring-hydroxylating dioxygenase large terminal subunit
MLVTQQPVLRRFWYPVMPMAQLSDDQPQAFQLLGQKLVLWLGQDGQPLVLGDRCCHRSAQLSRGVIIDGCVRCPYHGWSYGGTGTCVNVPQFPPEQAIPSSYRVPSYPCAERYGYVWVCLADEPLLPIPSIPEAEDPSLRRIPEFYEVWKCSGLRMMENAFDNAHFSFVHFASFGNLQQPKPAPLKVIPVEHGLVMKAQVEAVNPPAQQKNIGIAEKTVVRTNEQAWYMPFARTLKITYPNGQFCVRNDTEAEAKTDDIIAFDRQVVSEDRVVLETTDYDTPLSVYDQQHMASDQPGIVMRHKLAALLRQHGEVEQRLNTVV